MCCSLKTSASPIELLGRWWFKIRRITEHENRNITDDRYRYIIYIYTCILGRTYSVERSIHLIEEH